MDHRTRQAGFAVHTLPMHHKASGTVESHRQESTDTEHNASQGQEPIVTDGGTVQPALGEPVTYIDDDGYSHFAVVLEPIPDAAYVTLAWAPADPRRQYVGPDWTVETSVFPHVSTDGSGVASSTHAFKPRGASNEH